MKIFLEIVLAFVILDVIIVVYVVYRRYRRKMPAKKIEEIKESWRKIIRQQDRRHAIMDADNLLDQSLSLLGYKGNLGTKLKKTPRLFSNINQIWAAHKVRNNIAHQINYEVSEQAYKAAMLAFKQAFKDLKIF
jgi:uncharacterized membrane protein